MFCVVDIETTGGSKLYSKITEVAIYRYDGKQVVDELVTLINPECSIPEYISRLTGITNEMVVDAPKFYEIARRIIEITDNSVFVAHNVSFDYGIIQHEFDCLGYDFKRETLCTVKLSRSLLPGYSSYSLGNICRDLNIEINGRHRAGGDALATVKLFEILIDKNGGIPPIKNNEKPLNKTTLNPEIIIENFDNLPQKTGVYYFKNSKNEIIYIGKSKNIKSRVFNHLKGGNGTKASKMVDEIVDVDSIITGNELIALLKESEDIKMNQPKYNRALRKKNYRYGLYSYYDRKGYCRLVIKKPTANENPILIFSSQEQASQKLYQIMDEYTLCQKMCGVYEGSNGCFHYQLKQCHGACIGKEDQESYNNRVHAMLRSLDFGINNLIIIDKGRSSDEFSVVCIENGSYVGYGYFYKDESFSNPKDFFEIIALKEDNRDARKIISSYLNKNKPIKTIPF